MGAFVNLRWTMACAVEQAAASLRDLGVEAHPCRVDRGTHDGVETFWSFVTGLDRAAARRHRLGLPRQRRDGKNDKVQVACQGVDALFAGDDHVVGGDEATQQQAVDNRTTPEPEKAVRQGAMARPPHAST